jgi:hypothetical protein
VGIWRNPTSGIALGAYAGLIGKPVTEKLPGVEMRIPPGSSVQTVRGQQGTEYLMMPLPEGALPEKEGRAVLDALAASLRLA